MPTILAVDDSATMRKALEITFSGTEFDIVTCDNPATALEKVKTAAPALVIADISLPPTDGYELCTTIKLAAPQLPVLMLSSRHHPFDPARGGQADGNIDKPFDTQVLADKVREVLAAAVARPAAPPPVAAARPAARPPVAAAPPTPAARPPIAARPAAFPPQKDTLPLGQRSEPVFQPPARPARDSAPKQPPPSRPSAARPAAAPVARGGAFAATQAWGAKPIIPEPQVAPQVAEPKTKPRPPTSTLPGVASAPETTPTPSPTAAVAQRHSTVSSWPAPKDDEPEISTEARLAPAASFEGRLSDLGLSAEQVQGVLALSREVIEQVVWEVVPSLAETIIKEEIARLTRE